MVSDPVQWLTQLLALMGYSTQVTLTPKNDGGNINHWLEIDTTGWRSDQIQNLIGHEGAVIDAIQYLANTILNVRNTEENYQFFTVEIAGYRARRMAQIAKIAQEAQIGCAPRSGRTKLSISPPRNAAKCIYCFRLIPT